MTQILDVSPTRSNTTLTQDDNYQSVSGRMLSMAVGTDGRLYAGTYANVWRSDDLGRTFMQSTRPQPGPGQFDVPGALDGWEVYDLAVSPVDSNIVLAITRYDLRITPRHGIYRSTDGGNSWSRVHQFPGLPTAAGQIVWAQGDANLVYAAWGSAVAISRDAGATFTDTMPWGSGAGAAYHVAVATPASRVPAVYALGRNQMWVSLDGGNTWAFDTGPVPTSSGDPTDEAQSNTPRVLVTLPQLPLVVLLITSDGKLWTGGYEFFRDTQESFWAPVQIPEFGDGELDSGNFFIDVVPSGSNFLMFYCAKSRLYVAQGIPVSTDDWQRLDEGHHVHLDLHGVFFSSDFQASFDGDGYNGRAGTVWLLSDGGVHRSSDGGRHFRPAEVLSTLGTVNISGVAQDGKTALCVNTGDNSGFYSLNGGESWKTQAYVGGDNDCSYADPLQPDRMLVFTPRNGGKNRSVTLYVNPSGGLPDGRKGTDQAHQIPGPPAASAAPNWTAVSTFALRGYRPIVLTRRGEQPLPDGDYVVIRYKTDSSAVLLRTQAIRSISGADEWDTTATSPAAGTHVFQQGPPLPSADIGAVQAAGGHAAAVFYVGMDANRRLWKWTDGMASWKQIVPSGLHGVAERAIRFFIDPYRPDIVFVVDDVHVWRSEDGGSTWVVDDELERQATNAGALPTSLDGTVDVVLEDMQFDPDDGTTRFAVGVAGAFFTVDGVHWNRLLDATVFTGRPNSCYYDAVSDPCQRALYVGFAGRGVVKLSPLPWGSLQAPDPASWTENVRIEGQQSKAAPALAVFRNVIHMVHLGNSSNDIWWSTSTDGLAWTPNVRIPGQRSKATPALAVFNDRLHMVHLGDSSNDIWWSMFDGISWNKSDGTPGNERIPGQQSKAAPALATYGNRLHMVHLGDSSNDIWWSSYDGRSWWSNTRIRCQKGKSPPALAAHAGLLHMVHLGDSSNRLWWSAYDGSAWTPNLVIPGQKSKATPALAATPGDARLLMVHLGDSSNNLWVSLS